MSVKQRPWHKQASPAILPSNLGTLDWASVLPPDRRTIILPEASNYSTERYRTPFPQGALTPQLRARERERERASCAFAFVSTLSTTNYLLPQRGGCVKPVQERLACASPRRCHFRPRPMPPPPSEDFSLPLGAAMHPSASSQPRRPSSGQPRRLSSMRSGRPGSAVSSRQSASSLNTRNSTYSASHQNQTEQRRQQQLLEHEQRTSATSKSPSESKWWRIHFFRGMKNDLKRRAPFYWSDWTDAWDYRIVPATVYMYFAK